MQPRLILDLWGALSELRELGIETILNEGALLWREGDRGDEVAFLTEGVLEVVHEPAAVDNEVVIMRSLEKGSIVGDIACLDGLSRSATVRAKTTCKVLKMSGNGFRELLRRRPDLLYELFWEQIARVRSLTVQVTRNHHRAITDNLTQLYNYGFFQERLLLELERAAATGDPVSVVIFDIDHFKHYNDTNGHQEGNRALQEVARILKKTGRRGDIVARYGGEEFVALLYGATREEAGRFAEAVRRTVEATDFPGGPLQPLGRLTISGGVASFPADAGGSDELIAIADANLYKAKKAGRNGIVGVSAP